MHLVLVTAAEPAMCYPERTSSSRAFAASCHVQPLLTRVSEGRSLFTACSLLWKPWSPSRSWCFMLTTGGFVGSRVGRSVLETWQEWQAESELRAARHCYEGRQLKEEVWSGISACLAIAVGFAASSCWQSVKFAEGACGLFWQLQTHSA